MQQTNEPLRIVLSGGGTGGHIYPALALCQRLKETNTSVEFLYIGSERGLEQRIVSEAGIPFKSVEIQGIKRSLSFENVRTIYLMYTAIRQAKKYLREFNPDVVIGTGGYVCAPVLYAATRLNIPTIIHEQNSVAGLTNKFLARYVDRIAITFERVRNDFTKYNKKIRLVGNPRAQEVYQLVDKNQLNINNLEAINRVKQVLIVGGSRGAEPINEAALKQYELWKDKPYEVTVVTGRGQFETLNEKYKEIIPHNVHLKEYISNMPEQLMQTDLIVTRSGATTLTELTALGIPSILIPSPYVTNNHQEKNARDLVDKQASRMILERDLTSETLVKEVDHLMGHTEQRQMMGKNAFEMGIRDAADRFIDLIDELVNNI
ncbi:undecaprenyldiphospho-muramoylpentapeptide beta-N-acetylglucosaminyltransferase [Atopobacter phocae]|uniref:undecaprenyldiphospho-muramoylpentapeptide beta-N-acetylglucosaminyltransferase n=1 Tax=Atopobacter phocae TaxID=136492 RepID=UPI0004B2044E|nr:undecaprenyldiphospho-muramoylpentapeptide beta-N-acetylglucosaminyltransferase [Atopobacter phocae]